MRSRSIRRALPALWAPVLLAFACTYPWPPTEPHPARRPALAEQPASEAGLPLAGRQSQPLFWRVTNAPGATLHLLGSLHIGPPEGWSYPDLIDDAFDAATMLVVEIDDRDIGAEMRQALLAEHALLPTTESLRERLSPRTWEMLLEQSELSGLPLASLERLQPWMVANLLVIDAAQRRGLSPQTGVDQDFLGRAGARRVVPLETSEAQMALMSGLTEALQEFSLLETLSHADDIGDYLESMVEAWRVGDEEALSLLLFEGLDERTDSAVFFERLIFERNETMAKRLLQLVNDEDYAGQSAFAVIGAGHLVGSRSICALLAAHGYHVELLTASPIHGAHQGGE